MSERALSPSIHSLSLSACFVPFSSAAESPLLSLLLRCHSLSRALKWPRRVTSFFGPDSDRAAAYIFLVICKVYLSLEYLQHSRISALMRISKAH